MSERKWHVGTSVLISLLTISLITVVLITPPVSPQVSENVFAASPGAFTVRDVPPMGEPYTIPQNIVVWNRDNIERVVSITTEIPSENSVTSGYEPIPNESWVTPFPSSVLIEENSFAIVQISFNIPSWENLTGKKWEVWIPVERQALPGEPVAYGVIVRMKIETTEELPAAGIGVNLALLAVGLVIAVVVICTGVWFWSRKRGRGKPGKGVFSRR